MSETAKTPELLPCPFCPDGGDVWQPAPLEVIRCSQCGAEGPYGKSDDDITELWNTRAAATTPAPTAKFVELLGTAEALLYKMARHIRNTDEVAVTAWGVQGLDLLAELQELNPEKYDAEVRAGAPTDDSCPHWREGDTDVCPLCGDDLGPTSEADVAPTAEATCEDAFEVCRLLTTLDWIVGYELVNDNQLILDRAQELALKVMGMTDPPSGKEIA